MGNHGELINKGDHFSEGWGPWDRDNLACVFLEPLQREASWSILMLSLSPPGRKVMKNMRTWDQEEKTWKKWLWKLQHRHRGMRAIQYLHEPKNLSLSLLKLWKFPMFVFSFNLFFFSVYFLVTSRKIPKPLTSPKAYVITIEMRKERRVKDMFLPPQTLGQG